MTIAAGITPGDQEPTVGQVSRCDSATLSDNEVPAPAPGLELLGPAAASGHRDPPSLVRRGDGQTVQLTPLLYTVLEAIDGRRTLAEIATVVSEHAGKLATGEDIRFLIDQKLRPLGIIRSADGTAPHTTKANPLLALRCRIVVSNPDITDAIANKFAPLFRPACVVSVIAAFIATTVWVLFDLGLAHPARETLYNPSLLIAVFVLTAVSAAFHEVGHASACRYGGARPGVMGAGLYLLWPAFYTDVSDAYRLDRRGRLRVDLGGIYFNAVFAVAAVALYSVSGSEALLIVVPLQLLQMVRHLAPLVRLDGYHILSDLTGVPDLFAHMGPVLSGLLPWRRGCAGSKALRPWARFVVTAWVLIVAPMLAYTFVILVVVFPRLAATSWDSLGSQWIALRTAFGKSDIYTMGAVALSMIALALPVVSISYILVRSGRRLVRAVWRATDGRPLRRAGAVFAGIALIGLLVSTWLPDSQRRPISGDERGTVSAPSMGWLTPVVAHRAGAAPVANTARSSTASASPAATTFSTAKPTQIAIVAIPTTPLNDPQPMAAPTPWQSPIGTVRFNPPSPGPGDNFATVVNTQDGSFLVAANFSLVFADGDDVENSNRAYALANCQNCSTLAVAFQVVLVVTDADTITPENLAFAINAACAACDTRALAMQLVATTGPLNDHAIAALLDAWKPVAGIEHAMVGESLAQIQQQLFQVESQILNVLTQENPALLSSTDSQQAGGAGGSTTTSTTSDAPTPSTEPPVTASSTDGAPPPASTATITPSTTPTTDTTTPATDPASTTTVEPTTTTTSAGP
jgi:putative peptide zinc metalloprotease protein